MNKTEKLICILLGLVFCGWLWWSVQAQKKAAIAAAAARKQALAAQAAAVKATGPAALAAPAEGSAKPSSASAAVPGNAKPSPASAVLPLPSIPEQTLVLSNAQMSIVVSTWGATLKSAKLAGYAENRGKISKENPELVLSFTNHPALAVEGVAGLAPNAAYTVQSATSERVTLANAALTRTITLKKDYQIAVEDAFAAPAAGVPNRLSLGEMEMGSSKNDILSIDSMPVGDKAKVLHHDEEKPLKDYLSGLGGGFGCGGSRSAAGLEAETTIDIPGAQKWIVVKSRFFVCALAASSEANTGFRAVADRNTAAQSYQLRSVAAEAQFADVPAARTVTLFVGPKKQALLWDLGMRDVMEFGMWRWVCYPLVWLLNLSNSVIPGYGIAIIFLTFLVRFIFWPLTHKTTVSMRKMQEIQPKIKEIQKRCKGNPQKLQQETWACYKENKVNPLSSCLPMLIQIPVFIALFTVLRSAVELRYAPFLWIGDLSEPENLWPNIFPFGGLNILPILMAATMAIQSLLTPTTGDSSQQKMMIIFMPIMMLVMFYSFPSALSLYWTLSQVLSIVQMWWIKKKYGAPAAAAVPASADTIDIPQTRQMRRHGDK